MVDRHVPHMVEIHLTAVNRAAHGSEGFLPLEETDLRGAGTACLIVVKSVARK